LQGHGSQPQEEEEVEGHGQVLQPQDDEEEEENVTTGWEGQGQVLQPQEGVGGAEHGQTSQPHDFSLISGVTYSFLQGQGSQPQEVWQGHALQPHACRLDTCCFML
jgi:hypothetical protein